MTTIKSTDENFEKLVKENKIIIFDFWATWCGPCTSIAPILEEITNENPEWVIAKHDIDSEPNQPTVLGVRGIPTMVMFVDGKQVSTKVGAVPKSAIVSWIKESISS